MQLKSDPQSFHSRKTLSELAKYAPNISLNNAPRRWRFEVYFWAICGVLVQASVLVIAGLVSHWKLRKGGQPVEGYAFPVTILGTLLLTLGMYCCSAIVETGSKEKQWGKSQTQTSKKRNCTLRILWLQRRHIVSDQIFDAYAIIARGRRDYILTSHPAHTTAQLEATRNVDNHPVASATSTSYFVFRIKKTFIQNPTISAISKYLLSKRFESATVLGTMVSLTGFILQFIGLRASHWSVSVAQLGATVIMTTIRAIIRRGLIVRPHAQLLLHDHEMDWLATRISDDPDSFWSHFNNDKPQDAILGDCPDRGHRSLVVKNDANIAGIWGLPPRNPKFVEVRQRLGQLSKWTGPASEPAISVATAVEIVMDTLF